MKRSDTTNYYVAITHVQHPLTGDAVPTVKRVTSDTTIGELQKWYKELFPKCTSMQDVRITEAT